MVFYRGCRAAAPPAAAEMVIGALGRL